MKTLLKKTTLILVGALLISSFAKATVHRVKVSSNKFTPSSFTASIGDTVKWVWVSGGHNTVSETIPGGSASWNASIDNASPSDTAFEYKITTVGTFNYECTIHASCCGMTASFTVNTTTNVSAVSGSATDIAKFFPNPATSVVNIHLNSATNNSVLIINDILGKEVSRQTLSSIDNKIDVSMWRKGIYLYHLENNGQTMEGKLEVQ
jgi:plastocyanin